MFRTPPGIGIAHFVDFPMARVPRKTALIDDRESLTFAEIDERANRLARAFGAAGARPGDRAALILPNAVAFVVTEIAILRAGMVKVPLNIRFHVEEVLYALADCEPTIVVCDRASPITCCGTARRLPRSGLCSRSASKPRGQRAGTGPSPTATLRGFAFLSLRTTRC